MTIISSNLSRKIRGKLRRIYAKIVKVRKIFCIMLSRSTQGEVSYEITQKRLQSATAVKFAKELVNRNIPLRGIVEKIKGGMVLYSNF